LTVPRQPGRIQNTGDALPLGTGGMAERTKATVLKTVVAERSPRVRIPLPPPYILGSTHRRGRRTNGPVLCCAFSWLPTRSLEPSPLRLVCGRAIVGTAHSVDRPFWAAPPASTQVDAQPSAHRGAISIAAVLDSWAGSKYTLCRICTKTTSGKS
jgi:hypothetical protein